MKIVLRNLVPLITSVVLTNGCTPITPQAPVQAIFAIDVSCPAKARLIAYASMVYRVQRSLPPGSKESILIFGHRSQIVYEGGRILGRDTFDEDIGKYLSQSHAVLTQPGTSFDCLFEAIASEVKQTGKPCVIVIATDGGMEDQSSPVMKDLDHAFTYLSHQQLEGIALVGVNPAFRSEWKGWLRPLGDLARVRGMQDAGDVLAHPQVGGRS